jgi:hypothetical protein
MANEQVSIRLTTQGGEQILRVLEQIGTSAQTQFRKASQEARDFSRVAGDLARIPVAQTPMQVMANAYAGVSPRVSAAQTEERGADVEAAFDSADRLRAKYAPLFALEREHVERLNEVADAARAGAMSHQDAATAVDRLSAAYEKQRALAVAAAQAPLNALLGVRDDFGTDRRGADVEAGFARADAIRDKYLTITAVTQRYEKSLEEINEQVRANNFTYAEASVAVDRLTAAYERNYAAAVKEAQRPLNDLLGVRDAPDTDRRGTDIAAYGAELDRLEAKHAPLRAANKALADDLAEIQRIRRSVDLTDEEVAAATTRAQTNYAHRLKAVQDIDNIQQGGMSRWDKIDALRQFQDIGVSLAGGQNPLLVGAQQLPQLFDIAARQPDGAVPALRRFGDAMLRYAVHPVTLLTAGLGGLTLAALRYSDQQERLDRAVNGVGRLSGVSGEGLRAIASSASRSGALGQGQAVDAAAQYAAAGIGAENLPTLLADTRRYAHAFGLDLDTAQKEIAQIVSEDGLGAFERRFGSVSFATRQWVEQLERSGRFAEAAAAKTALLDEQTHKAKDAASLLTRGWEFVSALPGDALGAIGKGLAALTPRSRLVELPRPAAAVEAAPAMGSLADYERRIGLTPERAAAQDERRLAELRRSSGLAGAVVDQLNPETEQRRSLERARDALQPFTESAEALAMLGDRAGEARETLDALNNRLAAWRNAAGRVAEDSDAATQAVAAYSFEERALAAERQAEIAARRQDGRESVIAAERARARAGLVAESSRRLADMEREAADRAQLRGLTPLQASLREIETRFARLREQAAGGDAGRVGALQRQARLDLVAQTSFQALDAARPDLAERRQIADTRAALNEMLTDPDGLAALGDRADEARQALGNLDNRLSVWRSNVQTIAQDASLAAQATEAYTFGQRQLVAQQQAWLQVMRQSGDASVASAEAERKRVEMIAQSNRMADDMLRSARNETALIGMTSYEASRERIRQEFRDFRAQNVGDGRTVDYRTTLPPVVLAPIETGFKAAGDAATRLADALLGAADRIVIPTAHSTTPAFAGAGAGKVYDPRGVSGYIQERAAAYGLNPAAVLRIAQSEGLSQFYGDKGTSFGALQLHVGGGLGDIFRRQTGLDPSDPRNERMTIDWGLRYMAQTRDVSPWHGAARVGVTNADVFGAGAEIRSRADSVSRAAENERLRGNDWSQIGSQVQALEAEMRSHVRLLDMQRGALTASDATLQGLTEAQRLYNQLAEKGVDVENATTEVKRNGVLSTISLKDAILDHGRAAAEAARADEEFARARRRYIGELDLVRGGVQDTGSGVLKAWAHGEDAGAAARNALRNWGDRGIDFGWNAITENLLGPQGSASLGIVGDILGIGGGDKQKTTQRMDVKSGVVYVSGLGGLSGGGSGGLLQGLLGGSNSNFFGQAADAIGPFQQSSGGFFGDLLSGIGSLFGFEAGGVMTSRGALPLHRYEKGGVADRPQLALFGEGRVPEAYIPMTDPRGLRVVVGADGRAHVALPDGRGIPATIDGRDRLALPGGLSLRSDMRLTAFADGGVMTAAGPAPLSYAPALPSPTAPLRMSSPAAVAAASGGAGHERRPIEVKVVDGRGGNDVEVQYATPDQVVLMISARERQIGKAQQHADLKSW